MQIVPRDLIICLVIAVAASFIISKIFNKYKFVSWNTCCIVFFTFFMTVIFSLTGISPISGFSLRHFGEGINYMPFTGIVEMISQGPGLYSLMNIVGNVLMFAPIGFFAPILYKGYKNMLKTTLVGAAISLIIEGSQLFLARGTDIDDVILNTLGAVVGFGIYKVGRRIMPKLFDKVETANQKNAMIIFWMCVAVCYITIVCCGFYDRSLFMKRIPVVTN